MNANKTMIAVSTIAVAVTALTAALPASANDHRDNRRGERVVVTRHAPPQRVVYERPVYQRRPQVVVRQPVIVQRPVVVERLVVHRRSAPVYYHEPARVVYASPPPAPVYYDREPNPAGAIAGAVIGGVIGSQVGHGDARGVTTAIGAIFGGLIGSNF